jgi:hypothetical protein
MSTKITKDVENGILPRLMRTKNICYSQSRDGGAPQIPVVLEFFYCTEGLRTTREKPGRSGHVEYRAGVARTGSVD